MICFRKNKKEGQIAPFLIAVIVILLIALMVTVNLGKISLTRTATANSADAGALAGASTMANGLNAIKDISAGMFADFIATQAALAMCPKCWKAWVTYGAHVASQFALYAYAGKVARDTLKEAKKAGLQLAFSNAGITEAKPRECKRKSANEKCEEWETWEEWTKRKSRFEQWMEDGGYASGMYSWQDTQKYGQTARGTNSVTVSSSPPGWSVIPLPGIIVFRGLVLAPPKPPCCWVCCGPPVLPTLWGIAKVTGDTKPIRLRVTRIEPDINLGLWGMRYRKESEAGITSTSQGHAYGGSVMPFGSDYDSELTEAQ